MAYKIGPDCVCCGICEENCPNSCIKLENDKFFIDSDGCVECGSCEEVCLVGAITKENHQNSKEMR